jgi:hypothetical protein
MTDTFRKTYTPLDEKQLAQMDLIKTKAEELEALIRENTDPDNGRLMAVALTNLETAVMWAVKGVTN